LQKLDHELQNLKKDKVASQGRVQELEKLNPWILEEKLYVFFLAFVVLCHGVDVGLDCSHFGRPGTAYDFGAQDMAVAKEKFKELEESQKGLKKNINPKVINMIEG